MYGFDGIQGPRILISSQRSDWKLIPQKGRRNVAKLATCIDTPDDTKETNIRLIDELYSCLK